MQRILLIASLLSVHCLADTYDRFANVTCIQDSGFFELYGTGINDVSIEDIKNIHENSSLVHGGEPIVSQCKLGSNTFDIELVYSKAAAGGRCMGNPGGKITLKRNNQVLIDGLFFDWRCNWPDINRITIQYGKYIQACGVVYGRTRHYGKAFCIEIYPPYEKSFDTLALEEFIKQQFPE